MTPVERLMVSLSFRKLSYGLAESSPILMPLPGGTYWPYTPAGKQERGSWGFYGSFRSLKIIFLMTLIDASRYRWLILKISL
jgi:hypothetical protein